MEQDAPYCDSGDGDGGGGYGGEHLDEEWVLD
jgi:hypothetical protein